MLRVLICPESYALGLRLRLRSWPHVLGQQVGALYTFSQPLRKLSFITLTLPSRRWTGLEPCNDGVKSSVENRALGIGLSIMVGVVADAKPGDNGSCISVLKSVPNSSCTDGQDVAAHLDQLLSACNAPWPSEPSSQRLADHGTRLRLEAYLGGSSCPLSSRCLASGSFLDSRLGNAFRIDIFCNGVA